jgi:hypothetical protein
MRRDPDQDLALAHILAHQPKIEQFEVTQAAVNQARRAGGGPGPEIFALDQANFETSERGVTGDSAADDATTDN